MKGTAYERTAGTYYYLARHPELYDENGECNIYRLFEGLVDEGLFSKHTNFCDTVKILNFYAVSFKRIKEAILKKEK